MSGSATATTPLPLERVNASAADVYGFYQVSIFGPYDFEHDWSDDYYWDQYYIGETDFDEDSISFLYLYTPYSFDLKDRGLPQSSSGISKIHTSRLNNRRDPNASHGNAAIRKVYRGNRAKNVDAAPSFHHDRHSCIQRHRKNFVGAPRTRHI